MKKVPKLFRKFAVAAVGIPVLILGIILIPLPGPGLLVCFAGLFILSLEFEWIKPHLERVKAELKKIIDKSKERSAKIENKIDKK